MSMDFRLNVLRLPGVHAIPLNESELVTNLFFVPLARRLGTSRGVLIDTIEFGSFRLIWGVSTLFPLPPFTYTSLVDQIRKKNLFCVLLRCELSCLPHTWHSYALDVVACIHRQGYAAIFATQGSRRTRARTITLCWHVG